MLHGTTVSVAESASIESRPPDSFLPSRGRLASMGPAKISDLPQYEWGADDGVYKLGVCQIRALLRTLHPGTGGERRREGNCSAPVDGQPLSRARAECSKDENW